MFALPETEPASLAAGQADFASALFELGHVPQGLCGPRGVAPARRFDVHRNNMLASLVGCLRSTYPAVCRLVGDDFFNAAARLYVERAPPASPVLLHYGAGLDRFLQSFGPAQGVPYLADIARLEWHIACVAHAKDAEPIDGAILGQMAVEDAAHVRFVLHPALRLMRSPHPVVSIWRTSIHDTKTRRIVAPQEGEAALVTRPHLSVQVERLDVAAFEFIAALGAGYALSTAAEFAARRSDDFNLTVTLMQIFGCGAVVDIVTGRQRQPLTPEPDPF